MDLTALEAAETIAETHISRIVRIEDRVYKRKVAKQFGFVDQRSLDDRRRLCELEVRLNRRFAADVYLGTEPVTDEQGAVVDYVVVMRRMPRERSLAALLETPEDVTDCVRSLARAVAGFHARAGRSPRITAAGAPDAVRALWRDSLDDIDSFTSPAVDHRSIAELRDDVEWYLSGRIPLFEERGQAGLVVDGHGDLLTADVYCLPDGPRVLDCLEFDERFRFGDVLLDVAFLAMDLRWRGRPDLADIFVAAYGEMSAEHHPRSLLAHFVAYRAIVRAKVALYRARGGDPAATDEAAGLLALATQQLAEGTVRLVMVGGLPGTGKTALAEAMSARSGWVTVSTDAVRRELIGGPAPAGWGEGAYAPEMAARVYREVLARAETALTRGESVVIDGSFHDEARRADVRELGHRVFARVTELRCTAPAELAEERLLGRDRSAPSDATPAIADDMARRFAPWPGAGIIDTTTPLDDSIQQALTVILAPRHDDP